jgi:hypothetical protein
MTAEFNPFILVSRGRLLDEAFNFDKEFWDGGGKWR